MIEIFQGISQAFHDLCQRSIVLNFKLLLKRYKSKLISISLYRGKKVKREKPSWLHLLGIKHGRYRRRPWIIASLMFFLIVFSHYPQSWVGVAQVTTPISTPLSTKGSQIVDATGKQVLLRGVNWFGMETDTHTPHGLWVRDYKEMLAQIKKLGYNVIRLPYSVQALRASNISGVNFSIGNNKDFQGKTPLQVMDLVIAEAQRQGLLVMLDNHGLIDNKRPELWYGDGFTETDWINTWKMLANRYKSQSNVIAADLKNEPYGKARWGNNDLNTDWRLAAERCAKEIQAIAPNWLIVVEGIGNVPEKNQWDWAGGNLRDVKQFPVRLTRANKLVYSPHEYGPGVYNAFWFSDPAFPSNMSWRWEAGFNYIATQGIAPIWIGEFGGRGVDNSSTEGIWQQKLVDFIKQKNLSFTYWSWNPNSTDTGGILQDDWKTVNSAKQQLLGKLVPVGN
jgi:endoglucanase